eukprot:scaffold2586_cov128-Isochrysis_galbana.AAC.1
MAAPAAAGTAGAGPDDIGRSVGFSVLARSMVGLSARHGRRLRSSHGGLDVHGLDAALFGPSLAHHRHVHVGFFVVAQQLADGLVRAEFHLVAAEPVCLLGHRLQLEPAPT